MHGAGLAVSPSADRRIGLHGLPYIILGVLRIAFAPLILILWS